MYLYADDMSLYTDIIIYVSALMWCVFILVCLRFLFLRQSKCSCSDPLSLSHGLWFTIDRTLCTVVLWPWSKVDHSFKRWASDCLGLLQCGIAFLLSLLCEHQQFGSIRENEFQETEALIKIFIVTLCATDYKACRCYPLVKRCCT